MKTTTFKLIKIIGELLLIILILSAIAIGVVRALFPYVDRYRPQFESWASGALHQPVKIDKVTASWKGIHPIFNLEGVTIWDIAGHVPQLHIQHLQVGANVIDSLLARRFQPSSFSISGAHFTVRRINAGILEINGIPLQLAAPRPQSDTIQNIVEWLLRQGQINLENIDLDWQDQQGHIFQFTQVELELNNALLTDQVVGLATLLSDTPTRFRFVINLKQQGITKSAARRKFSADVYVYIRNLDLTPWLKNYIWQGFNVTRGRLARLQLWGQWESGQWQQVQTVVNLQQASIYSKKLDKALNINQFSANLVWQRVKDGFNLAADQIKLDINKQRWPVTQFAWQQMQSTTHLPLQVIHVDALDLQQLQNLALDMAILPEALKTSQSHLQAQGILTNILLRRDVTLPQSNIYSASLDFHQLKTLAWGAIPAVKGLSGHLQVTPTTGDVQLAGSALQLDFGKMFVRPFTWNTYGGHIMWAQQDDGLKLQANDINLADATLAMRGNFDIFLPKNGDTPYIQLLANFSQQDARRIRDYLPMGMEHLHGLMLWFDTAFERGDGIDGQVLLQGPLSHFPFDDDSGHFQLWAHTHDIDLNYKTGWPPLHHLNADIFWNNRSLSITAPGAEIMGLPTGPIQAEIPDLGHAELAVRSSIQTDMQEGLRFISQSPLKKTLESLQQLQLRGPMQLDLQLHLPFYQGNTGNSLLGNIAIAPGGLITVPALGVQLTDVTGKLQFTQNTVTADQLTAKWLAQPVNIDITTQQPGTDKQIIQVQMDSHVAIDSLKRAYNLDFLKNYVEGETNFTAFVKISGTPDVPAIFVVNSDLDGIKINLPAPVKKLAAEKIPTSFTAKTVGKSNLNLFAQYGKKLSSAITLTQTPAKTWSFRGGDLRFGDSPAVFQTLPGLLIDGTFTTLIWSDVADFLTPMFKPQRSTGSLSGLLRQINLNFGQLRALGLVLSSVNIQATPQQSEWLLRINSPTMIGSLVVPKDLSATIRGDFDRFYLTSGASQSVSNINPGDIPPLNLTLRNFYYSNKPYGTVSLQTVPAKNTLQIRQLTMNMANINGSATGYWQQMGKGRDHSALNGVLTSSNMGAVLKTWGMTDSVINSKGKINFELSWPAPAYDFSLKQLNGNFSLAFYGGRIINVGNNEAEMGIGKILNLLSLQSIPRRLSLDFSDLVQKGFSFDDMKGDFTVQNGDAMTRNAFLQGPIAKIDIRGRIGLAAKDYNLRMMITPYVTSSLPVAATIVGGPIAGAVTWIGSKVLGGVVNKIAMHTYSVTGSWDSPVIVKTSQ